ncbi:Rod binding protein [Helicobacter sp. faydin-H20]|uniref:Rod binding protein n=1 Tax=Helicobacter anatolicus TaxID=2905874 RepID=UPI001E6131D1|nr:Rod binding protein [Helicobacter anatolicus]MCE3036581.1 Rod binding protein [Helicobacter anatolicus]
MASAVNKNLKPNLNASDEKLKEQTDAFESLILKTLLDTALKFENPLYPKEAGNEIYQSMYKDTLANSLSGSFGYSQLLFDFLKEQQAGKR